MKICEVCRARFRGDPTTCPLDGGELVPLPDPLVGRTIGGRYVVEDKIGEGGMGTVYRAHHDVVGRDVAIKFLSPDLAHDDKNRTRFLREARAANRINHEHIIDITDYGETDDGLVYLVMEFLVGKPLDAEIQRGPLDVSRALRIGYQAARALARAHELDVIHRDIKAENVYLLSGYDDDFVKILDFGLAHMKGELRVTATGAVFGTPEYMAPEQARGKQATHAADLYAVGCLLFEMLTGRLPFEGGTTELILAHMRYLPPAPSKYRPDLPKVVDGLVLALLEKDPADRPASAYALAEMLKETLDTVAPSEAIPLSRPVKAPPDAAPERDSIAYDETAMDAPQSGATQSATRTTSGNRHLMSEDVWAERVGKFRELLARVHPAGDAPSWLREAIDRLDATVEQTRQLRQRLGKRDSEASKQEKDIRQMRMRLGRAIDQLARDEANAHEAMSEVEQKLGDATRELQRLEGPLLGLWRTVPAPPPHPRDITRDKVRALRGLAELAAQWDEAEQRVAKLTEELSERQRERDDLRFQIGQLKGRLASLSAAQDYDVEGIKAETAEIDRELQSRVDRLVSEAEPIVRYFMGYPELRDEVLGRGGGAQAVKRSV